MPPDGNSGYSEIRAELRHLRETLAGVQVSVGRIEDLANRLDKIERNQEQTAKSLAEMNAQHRSTAKLMERWLPWLVAILASGGLFGSEMLNSAPTLSPSPLELAEE